jgi:formiminoglutamase
MTPVNVVQGDSPVILGLPHTGTWLPPEVFARLTPLGQSLADTDWHIERLYADLLPGATQVRALFHRYLIDANRDPSGQSLYPGQNTTGLVPLTDFDGQDLWLSPPDATEIAQRCATYHAAYHQALAAEIARIKQRHGLVILYDCHSIRSRIPYLFEGRLPDLNIGTNGGQTCAPALQDAVVAICQQAQGYTSVLNGRFRGGWTTRHYGRPEEGQHAIQMEVAQSAYLASEAPPFAYDPAKAEAFRRPLQTILETLETRAFALKGQA